MLAVHLDEQPCMSLLSRLLALNPQFLRQRGTAEKQVCFFTVKDSFPPILPLNHS